jgi:hypothetical protein
VRGLPAAVGCALLVAGCAPPGTAVRAPSRPLEPTPAEMRAGTTALAHVEDMAIGWMAAADPRLAARANTAGPREILARVGMEAVLAEDTAAVIRGSSLDLFAFRARAHALDEAGKGVAAFASPLPEVGLPGSPLARPRLERELLARLIAEERARTDDEARLGDASGDLVRAMVSTWTPPADPQEVMDRDAWASKHLLAVRDSLGDPARRWGPPDLDVALYPLERLLAPLEYPRATTALVEVRVAMDADMRAVPRLRDAETVARAVKVHLGLDVDSAGLPARLGRLEVRLHDAAERALTEAGLDARAGIESRARELLLVERPCPAVTDTRVRAMTPPAERAAVCGALRALTEEPVAAALVALHDDVFLSLAAVMASPPPRTGLLSHPENDDVDTLQRVARERPVVVLGVALAAEILYAGDGADQRLAAWRALGEVPLDIAAREIVGAVAEARGSPLRRTESGGRYFLKRCESFTPPSGAPPVLAPAPASGVAANFEPSVVSHSAE